MSTTGDQSVGTPTGKAVTALMRPMATSRDEAIEASLEGSRVIGSPGYPTDDAVLRQRAADAYDRSYCPEGTARQLAAVLASPDRTEGLHGVRLPFLVDPRRGGPARHAERRRRPRRLRCPDRS